MKSILLTIALISITILGCSEETTNPPADPVAYTNADGIKGGMMFDEFWSVESGFDQTNSNIAKFNASSDFFRCKQCHGWDLMGRNGSYIGRGPKTTRPNIADRNLRTTAQDLTAQELFNAIKNGLDADRRDVSADLSTYDPTTNNTVGDQMPDFSQILTDSQIWNLVKYLKTEAIDVSQLYDAAFTGTYPTGKASYSNIGKDGDATAGLAFYNTKCQVCHGTDGKQIPDLDKTTGLTVGKYTRSKPNELQHKVKFGKLGSAMLATSGTLADYKNLYKALVDTVQFPN